MFSSVITLFSYAEATHFYHAQITYYQAKRDNPRKEKLFKRVCVCLCVCLTGLVWFCPLGAPDFYLRAQAV